MNFKSILPYSFILAINASFGVEILISFFEFIVLLKKISAFIALGSIGSTPSFNATFLEIPLL